MAMTLFGGTSITASITPFAEITSGDINIWNGNEYTKVGNSPIPFKFSPLASLPNHILTQESVYAKTVGTYGNNDIPMTKGLVRKLSTGAIRSYTMSYDIIMKDGNATRSVAFSNDVPVEVLYKSADETYDIIKTRATNADHTQRLYWVSNIDSTPLTLILTAQTYTDYVYLDEDTTYVYLLATMVNGVVNLVTINKSTKVGALVTTPTAMTAGTKASTNIKQKVMNPLVLPDGTKKFPIVYLNTSGVNAIRTINYNPNINTGTFTDRLSVSEYALSSAMIAGLTNVSSYEIVCTGENIVNILHKKMGVSTATTGMSDSSFGIVTLVLNHTTLIATNTGLVLTTTSPPVHMTKFGSSMYVYSVYGYAKMDWDAVNNKYIKIIEKVLSADSYGLDEKGYMYAYYYNSTTNKGQLDVDSPFFADKVEILDMPPITVYQGTDITLVARVAAYNSSGAKIAAPVTLVINEGQAVFSSTGTKTINLTTSTDSYLSVAIIISGDGPLKVTPKSAGILT